MKKRCVLISGCTIANDTELLSELHKISTVIKNSDNWRIISIIAREKVDLILIEITGENFSEVEIIKNIIRQYPDIEIILIDGMGDQEVIASAFKYGIKDAFRKPYKTGLISERVNALLEGSS